MFYSYVQEEKDAISVNNFRAEFERAYKELESDVIEVKQRVETNEEQLAVNDANVSKALVIVLPANHVQRESVADTTYIKWQIFDEIPERVYTIECEGYVDKNRKPLNDVTFIKHLTSGKHVDIVAELEYYDENSEFVYMNYNDYLCMDHSKNELSKTILSKLEVHL